VNIQKVMYILEDMERASDNPEATRLLTDAQGEIMRLSRMVGGMLTLASISENPERRKTDFTALLQSASNVLELFLQKRGNRLETELAENLMVFCDSDLLSQVIVNLLQNAHGHTENDAILLRAVLEKGKITVTVRDNGTGIAPDLLPRVFERGVSDGGGTGVRLYLCKTVIESHGGAIWIDSTPGAGTIVRFTLPVYEGQYGGDAV
jgi:signal transduction histidine kinase